MLGNTGAALTAARIMPIAFYERKLHQPAETRLMLSVKRALLGRLEMYGLSGKSTFFNKARMDVQQALEGKSQRGGQDHGITRDDAEQSQVSSYVK
jgi:hypothetical protein